MDDTEIHDVAIVGYGPVGAALAILLGQRGHRVVVLERHREPYPLPARRALRPRGGAHPPGVRRRRPLRHDRRARRDLRVPERRAANAASVRSPRQRSVRLAAVVDVLATRARGGAVRPRRRAPVGRRPAWIGGDRPGARGRDGRGADRRWARAGACYVVGCDGANSTVRSLTGIPMADRAFFYDWLVVDVVFHEPRVFDPLNVQICDPARPTTVVSGGPGRRRWEFMALPGESIEALNEEATAWRLLEPFDARPDNARLEKHAVYRFQARWVEEWRRGRVLLAGDAAHQTPPFAGPGPVRRPAGRCQRRVEAGSRPPGARTRRVARHLRARTWPACPGRHRARDRDGQADLRRRPRQRQRRATRRSSRRTTAASPTCRPSRPSPTASCSPARRTRVSSSSRARWRQDGRRVRLDDAIGAGWQLVTLGEPAMDDELGDWFAGHRRGRRGSWLLERCRSRRRWHVPEVVRGPRGGRCAPASRLRAVRDGRGRGRDC